MCCCSCGQRGKVRQPPRTLGALTSPLYARGLYGKRGAGEWDPAGCHPVNAGPKEETALFMAEETTATAWCWVRYSHTVLRDCRGSCGAQGLRPHSEYSSVSGLPNPSPRASRTRSLGALAHTYPFLEVGPPLVVLPDHNLNATLPVFALCGDGLQPRGRNEKQVLGGIQSQPTNTQYLSLKWPQVGLGSESPVRLQRRQLHSQGTPSPLSFNLDPSQKCLFSAQHPGRLHTVLREEQGAASSCLRMLRKLTSGLQMPPSSSTCPDLKV